MIVHGKKIVLATSDTNWKTKQKISNFIKQNFLFASHVVFTIFLLLKSLCSLLFKIAQKKTRENSKNEFQKRPLYLYPDYNIDATCAGILTEIKNETIFKN